MHAFLVTSLNEAKIEEEITKLLASLNSKPYPFEIAKIEDVRALESFTKLALSENTTLIIKNLHQASEAAQNAFLKSLEEPQEKLSFILTANSPSSLLPTILSRCQLIEISTTPKASGAQLEAAKKFFDMSKGEKLIYISKFSKRENAIQFLEDLLVAGHALMLTNPKLSNALEEAQNTLLALRANANPTLQLTNFVLQLEVKNKR